MSSERRGRPPMDPFLRRMEIFEAVAPLIMERGVSGLTMREAGETAHLSRAGLYHWFDTKRQLVLFPLLPGVCDEAMRRFGARFDHLLPDQPRRYLEAMITATAHTALRLRPAVHAAFELGAHDLWQALDASMSADLGDFVVLAHRTDAHAAERDPEQLARTVRRQIFGALLDRTTTPGELAAALGSLVLGEDPADHDAGAARLSLAAVADDRTAAGLG